MRDWSGFGAVGLAYDYGIWIIDGGDRGPFDHTELEEDRE